MTRAKESAVRIAVLGAGNGGWACAGDLSLAGHEVRLWGRSESSRAPLLGGDGGGRGRMDVRGMGRTGLADIAVVTASIADAVSGADLVLVPLPAFAHEDVARRAAPHLEDGQVLVFLPGNFTSPGVARTLREHCGVDVTLVEGATLPYGVRRADEHAVIVVARNTILPAAAYPAERTDDALAALSAAFPQTVAAEDVLDAALLNPNFCQHPALIVTNAGAIEHFETYDIHAQGTTPATLRVIYGVDDERIAVREALGYPPPHYDQRGYYADEGEWLFEPGARHLVEDSDLWQEDRGLTSRYVHEDVAYGLGLVADAGDVAGVDTPTVDSLLHLATLLRGEDPREGVRSLRTYGFDDLSAQEMRARLETGDALSTHS